MTRGTLVIANTKDCRIEMTHRDSDPAMWIVRCWKQRRLFKKRISSDWFTDRQQALGFARECEIRMARPGSGLPPNVRVSPGMGSLGEGSRD